MTEIWLILGMMALTFGPRYLPFGLAGRVHLPPLALRALSYVPIAVLSAIAANAAIVRDQQIQLSFDNPFLLAALVAALIAWWSRHLFLTIAIGLIAFAGFRYLLSFA